LTEVVFKQSETLALDLEQFARHGKRTVISAEDVRLCGRRNEAVVEALDREIEKHKATLADGKSTGASKKQKTTKE